jgi:hypothetical protein
MRPRQQAKNRGTVDRHAVSMGSDRGLTPYQRRATLAGTTESSSIPSG